MNGLAVQREIETLALHLVAHAQPDEDVDDLEDDQRHDGVVDEDDDDAFDLVDHLHGVAFDQARRAAVLLDREHAGEQYGGTAGLIEGNAMQVVNQIEGIVIVFVYDAIVSLIILKIIDIFIGLRVSDEVEREGLDLALHGETV